MIWEPGQYVGKLGGRIDVVHLAGFKSEPAKVQFLLPIATPRKARSAAFLQTAPAQKLVDPEKVAPEFVATKRRAEQIKMMGCNKKAEKAEVLPTDRAAHVQHCLDGQQDPR
jgi:hypothetical protein